MPRSPRMTCFPRRYHLAATHEITAPRPRARDAHREPLPTKANEFAEVVKSGHTPHGRDAGHARPGVRGYATAIEHGVERLDGRSPASRRAAARWHRRRDRPEPPPEFARPSSPPPSETGLPLAEARTTSRPRGRGTPSSRPRASCGRSRSRSTRSPTTSAGCRPDRAAGSARSTSPTCNRAPRSCRGRSTPSSRRRCARSSPK